jgi:hypothetical protein
MGTERLKLPPAERHPREHARICQAYVRMAQVAKYRPQAPGDGMGGIDLSPEELLDSTRLAAEASAYADRFITQEDDGFSIGISDFTSNRALVYTIEAARNLCAGAFGIQHAVRLLEMATQEAKQAEAIIREELTP